LSNNNVNSKLIQLPVNYDTLTQKERRDVREVYIRLQKGRCCHCGQHLSEKPDRQIREMEVNEYLFPEGFFDFPVHLHHDHETGNTIGAVHARCNAVLWQYHGE
jgi:hypothetical protein